MGKKKKKNVIGRGEGKKCGTDKKITIKAASVV
jgi:hypothetical protein